MSALAFPLLLLLCSTALSQGHPAHSRPSKDDLPAAQGLAAVDGHEGGYADHDGEKTTHELSVGQIGHDQPKAYPYSSSSGDTEKTTLNDSRGLAALNGQEGGYAESDGEKTTHTLEAFERMDQVATEDETHEEESLDSEAPDEVETAGNDTVESDSDIHQEETLDQVETDSDTTVETGDKTYQEETVASEARAMAAVGGHEGGYADHDGEKTTHELSLPVIQESAESAETNAYPYTSLDDEKTTLEYPPRAMAALNGHEGGYGDHDGEKTTHILGSPPSIVPYPHDGHPHKDRSAKDGSTPTTRKSKKGAVRQLLKKAAATKVDPRLSDLSDRGSLVSTKHTVHELATQLGQPEWHQPSSANNRALHVYDNDGNQNELFLEEEEPVPKAEKMQDSSRPCTTLWCPRDRHLRRRPSEATKAHPHMHTLSWAAREGTLKHGTTHDTGDADAKEELVAKSMWSRGILVDAVARDDVQTLQADLKKMGGSEIICMDRLCSAIVPHSQLQALMQAESVQLIYPASPIERDPPNTHDHTKRALRQRHQ